MQHWNLLYLNCLGFFSDPGYLLLSLLPVPCLEKGRFGRSVCGDRRKEPSPGRAYRSQFEEKRQRTFRPYRFTGFAERNVCLGRAAVESCWRQEHDRSRPPFGKSFPNSFTSKAYCSSPIRVLGLLSSTSNPFLRRNSTTVLIPTFNFLCTCINFMGISNFVVILILEVLPLLLQIRQIR